VSSTLSIAPERITHRAQRVTRNLRADLLAVVVLAACALTLHRDGLFGGAAFYELDTRLFYYPLAQWVGQHLQAGVFPLWLPAIFTGYPIFADGELGLAYLPQLLMLYLLPAPLAMVWLRVLHAFLAGLFMHLYLRSLRLDPVPALGGALIFAFGGFLSAQMHHENVVRSAVWLPAVLLCAERAILGRHRLAWLALGGLAFGQAALGLHVQPVLMIVFALGVYVAFHIVMGHARPLVVLLSAVAIGGGGLGLAAVQWLPLGEWALVSSRRNGVGYEFASAFALSPENMLSVVFPFFFRLPDASTWWSLWQQWETELYVGIPTLALLLVGIVFAHRAELVYFVVLGSVSLWIAMAQYAPLLNLHWLLWSIPGFSFLRAPGRFTYLVVFACACLAAFGLQALTQRRLRVALALAGALPGVGLLAALLALLPSWRTWLMDDPARARSFVESTYLAARAQYPIDAGLVVAGFVSSLDLTNPKTAWSLALIGATSSCFVAWLALGRRRVLLGQGLFVALIGVDLLVFATDFHPRAPLASLTPVVPAGVTAGTRVLLHDAVDLPSLEPDQLLGADVQTAQGYSSLPSQRHVELEMSTRAQPNLIDLWSAPLVLEPARPPDQYEVNGVRFRASHPLAAGYGGALPSTFRAPTAGRAIAHIRLVGTLSYAFQTPQGHTVATLSADSWQFALRAGIELSERAHDRPSLGVLVAHQKAPVAMDFEEGTPEGESYAAHLYAVDIALPEPIPIRSLTLAPIDPGVLVEIQGIALVDTDGRVQSLDLGDREGFQRLSPEVVRDTRALPRAFVLPRSQAFSPARHAGLTATQLVANPDMDIHKMVLIEGDAATATEPSGAQTAVAASSVEDLGPNVVRVSARATEPSYLVLDDFYQRGWSARVDGQPARIFIANALFRAVSIEPGAHEVEFRFEPLSHFLGAVISAVSLVLLLVGVLIGYAHARE
jgi:Bacterial membrane protein YfhO